MPWISIVSWSDYKAGFGFSGWELLGWTWNDAPADFKCRIPVENWSPGELQVVVVLGRIRHLPDRRWNQRLRTAREWIQWGRRRGLQYTANPNWLHNGMKFTTYDVDNDLKATSNCAKMFLSGNWYNSCYYFLLTGSLSVAEWDSLKSVAGLPSYSLIASRMMIKRTWIITGLLLHVMEHK